MGGKILWTQTIELVSVAQRLKQALRPGDTLARLSGDEFAVLLNEVSSSEDAVDVAKRIHSLLSTAFVVKSHTIYQSASVGIALGAEKYTDPGQVLRDADLAMYRVKEVKDREVVIFDDHMHASLAARLRLETDLQRALERQELLIHYQPIVSLDTRQVLSFDALVRWQHPTHGLLPPESFIRMAEETGLINELSWWIIEQAACQTARWQRLFPSTPALAIAVNVTGNLFRNIGVAERFLNLLNMNSVAEGVERPEQVRFLREMNCPQTQGF